MKLRDAGEEGVIKIFEDYFNKGCRGLLVGLGDDCAVIDLDDERYLLISTDTIFQSTHIPEEMKPEQIGKYSVNVVLSDIAAMGGEPLGLVFSTGFPGDMKTEFVEKIAKGMEKSAKSHGTCVIGGDTQEMPQISITGTALGIVKKESLLLRSSAKIGDVICVTGEIGSAAAGFYCITNGMKNYSNFIKKALEPIARIEEGKIISKHANACIDVSDGIGRSIHEITNQSRVGAKIFEDNIPVDDGFPDLEGICGVSRREAMLYKGGDYELLFTISPSKLEKLEKALLPTMAKISRIGEATKGDGNVLIDRKGVSVELENKGWDAFRSDMFLSSEK